ncbi:MAG TPA: hypothetical protein VIJ94_08690 [Caulobacteraceae bacterium]
MSQAARPILTPLLALAAGPAAWAAQLIAGYGASSLACFPHDAPAPTPPGPGEHVGLAALNLVCLAVAVAGLATAFMVWRSARPDRFAEHNDQAPASAGREQFLGACGMLSGAIFCVAILFDTAAIFGAPACWSGLG